MKADKDRAHRVVMDAASGDQERSPGAASLHMGAMHGICYLTCPKCKRRIEEPFSRFSGPVPFVHHNRKCHARLIVWPSHTDHNHTVRRVSPDKTLESAMAEALEEALGRERGKERAA